jgi:DNA-directed RNA polymerase specialized sigma24 family protein
VQAIQSGDRLAFRQLYDRYYKYLVVAAYNVLGDGEKARDEKELFVKLILNAGFRFTHSR